MRLLSWNCQGLENPWTGRSLCKIMRTQVPMVCFLMETRLDMDRFEKLYGNLPFQNKIIVKHPDSSGGLAFLWKKQYFVGGYKFHCPPCFGQNHRRGWIYLVLDWILWMAGCTAEGKVVEVTEALTDFCGGTVSGYRRF